MICFLCKKEFDPEEDGQIEINGHAVCFDCGMKFAEAFAKYMEAQIDAEQDRAAGGD